jgi:hypothetical protein
MPYRESLDKRNLRLRKALWRKLDRAAKANDRSTNEEIARRLTESFDYGDWREDRERLVAAMMTDLASHPNPATTKAALGQMEEHGDRDLQKDLEEEGVFQPKRSKS